MADDFKKPKKIDFEPIEQDDVEVDDSEDKPLTDTYEGDESEESLADMIIEEYDRTIEFMKFLEELLRENSKVEVEIDPEDDPEVWMAMQRIFQETATPKMNQDSYFNVLDTLETIDKLEQAEHDPENELDVIPEVEGEEDLYEDEIREEDFQISAVDEIEQKSKVQRSSVLKDPPPPPPPPKPPEAPAWLRRWRKYRKRVNILGRPIRVQWLRNRWWRKDRR